MTNLITDFTTLAMEPRFGSCFSYFVAGLESDLYIFPSQLKDSTFTSTIEDPVTILFPAQKPP